MVTALCRAPPLSPNILSGIYSICHEITKNQASEGKEEEKLKNNPLVLENSIPFLSDRSGLESYIYNQELLTLFNLCPASFVKAKCKMLISWGY